MVEVCEARRLLTATPVTVVGTMENDVIDVVLNGDNIKALVNGVETALIPLSSFSGLVIVAGWGNDLINISLDLPVTIKAGLGDDTIFSGSGNDEIHAGEGYDEIHAGAGNDTVYAKNQNDTVYGDAGDDYIEGNGKADMLYGGDGQDTIYGNAGDDYIDGGGKADLLYGGIGDDTLFGGAGDDHVYGGDPIPDTNFASDGDDTLNVFDDFFADYADGGSGSNIGVIDDIDTPINLVLI